MSSKENMPGREIVLAEIRILCYDHPKARISSAPTDFELGKVAVSATQAFRLEVGPSHGHLVVRYIFVRLMHGTPSTAAAVVLDSIRVAS